MSNFPYRIGITSREVSPSFQLTLTIISRLNFQTLKGKNGVKFFWIESFNAKWLGEYYKEMRAMNIFQHYRQLN
jgi:hypothetical protein